MDQQYHAASCRTRFSLLAFLVTNLEQLGFSSELRTMGELNFDFSLITIELIDARYMEHSMYTCVPANYVTFASWGPDG